MVRSKLVLSLAILVTVATVLASNATIRLTAFPTVSVADSRSTVTISAELRDINGSLVPDGTRVLFATDLGTFRENVVQTQNGVARAILVAGSNAGVAKVTANAIAVQATATLDYEFVADRSMLSSAYEYIEVSAPNDLLYSVDYNTIGASGPEQAATLRYRDVEISADDLQVSVRTQEVKARRGVLKIGRQETEFSQLYFRLRQRQGFAVTTFVGTPRMIKPQGDAFAFVEGEPREMYGLCEVTARGVAAITTPAPPNMFDFVELADSAQLITAKSAVAYPNKEIQFHRADIFMGGARVMRLPLYKYSMYNQSQLITEQIVNVNDNQLAINYPYYLSLKPGQTSLLRFTMGQNYGRGLSANRGASLDYELNWDRGDEMQGGLTVYGIGRKDWGIGLRQYYSFDPTASMAAQLDFPNNSGLFGSASVSKQFPGFQASLSASDSRTFSGPKFQSQHVGFVLEKDPIKMGTLPVSLYLGATASSTSSVTDFNSNSQTTYGLRARLQSKTIFFDRDTALNGSLMASKLYGHNALPGLSLGLNLSLSRSNLFKGASMVLGYDYIDDGFNSTFIGKHQASLRFSYLNGNANMTAYMLKSLDLDRQSLQLDMGYRFSSLWRVGYYHTYDRYLGTSYLDYYYVLAYRMGYREIGLTWSNRTRRFGIQILGTTFGY